MSRHNTHDESLLLPIYFYSSPFSQVAWLFLIMNLKPILNSVSVDERSLYDYARFGPIKGVGALSVTDEFNFNQVQGTKCIGVPCLNITDSLNNLAVTENIEYICICMPCYNEEVEDLYSTVTSLLENFEFLKTRVRSINAPFQKFNLWKVYPLIIFK